MRETAIPIESHEQWLELREGNIGGSELATLFGQSMHSTYYQLYHEKAGNIDPPDLDNSLPVVVGQHMEAGLAKVIQHFKPEYDLLKSHRYLQHPTTRLGITLDYRLRHPIHGLVPAELKVIDFMSFKENWVELETAGEYDPPLQYAIQLQAQMLILDKPIGYLFALVGNKQLIEIEMAADPEVHQMILEAVDGFWKRIEDKDEPAPDYDKDLQAMYSVLTNVDTGLEISVVGDDWWEATVKAYAEMGAREKAAKEAKDNMRAQILERMGSAIRAKMASGTISAKVTERYGKPRRELRITPKRGLLNE